MTRFTVGSRNVAAMLVAATMAACGSAPPGPKGDPGAAAAPCTVVKNADGSATINCPDGTSVSVAGPKGDTGTPGTAGNSCSVAKVDGGSLVTCTDGTNVLVATPVNGTNGTNGSSADNFQVSNFHGSDFLLADQLAKTGKFYAKATITSATADSSGKVTVNFEVKDPANKAVLGIKSIYANIAKLVPPPVDGTLSYTRWVPYLVRIQMVSGSDAGNWPKPDGTWAYQGSRENNGTLTENGNGTYTYVFATNISNISFPDGGPAIAYERNLTHRVAIMMGGASGPTASAEFDFVPDGSAVTTTRNIVETTACKSCHGQGFAAHGGDRVTAGNCVTCHTTGMFDPQSGESLDFKVMIHKIHAGGELASIAGPDGIVWDNPATTVDESADNGHYAIWGFNNTKFEWWKVEFPAVIENCEKCHTGSGAQVNNWKEVPSRAACGSCHDTIDFNADAGVSMHPGGLVTKDSQCSTCHPATGTINSLIHPVVESHDWVADDQRNIPEFTVGLSVSAPANGKYFVAGEAPKVTFTLTDAVDGGLVDHTALTSGASAVGCGTTPKLCSTSRDGALASANFFVNGPRARRNPVLSSIARVKVIAPTNGPWDLSAAGASLIVRFDDGEDLNRILPNGQDKVLPSLVTVAVPATGFFANKAAATPTEVRDWLNANANFAARGIAYLDTPGTGRLAIRSRNLGRLFAIQLQTSAVATTVFGGDTTLKLVGGFTAANNIITDVKATKFSDRIEYQLDPVDDLVPGTYMVSAEIGDRGRVDGNNYKTPSVKIITFQVKQEAVEPPPAGNCSSCHQANNGKGFVLDYPRHNKIFSANAVDQCGACHDYQVQDATVAGWSGAGAIARRVHGVHRGSDLQYPLITVGYSNGDPVPGRNWDIEFPQDIRNCETCHPAATTSGTWKTKPARLPCGGCHDSDPATAHMKAMTFDPTPLQPYSGDELESCAVCHAP